MLGAPGYWGGLEQQIHIHGDKILVYLNGAKKAEIRDEAPITQNYFKYGIYGGIRTNALHTVKWRGVRFFRDGSAP